MTFEPSREGIRPPGRSESGPDRVAVAALLAVALVALLAGGSTLTHGLVYDDLALLPHQAAIRDPLDMGKIVTSTYWGREDNLYRPVTLWTLAANYGANRVAGKPGDHPAGYHLVNLLLHVGVCCCFCVWLRRLRLPLWPAVAAAALFAAHPLHTEAVAPIVGRSELLAALFGLLFLVAHRQRVRVPVGAVCYFLALASKESAIAFLPLAYWTDRCFPRSDGRRRWGSLASYLVALGGWLALRAAVLPATAPGIPFVDNPLAHASTAERWLTAARVQFDYLRLQVLPVGLSADYSYDQIPVISSLGDSRVLLFFAVAAGAGIAAYRLRTRHPAVAFGVVGYALLFALTSNIPFPIGTIMGERLAYAPSLMTCLLIGYGAWRLRRRLGRPVTVAVAVLVLLCTGLSVRRNADWRDEAAHVRALVRSAPRNAKAHYLMAQHLLETGRPDGAIASARAAISILPAYAEAWHQLGLALAARGEFPQAIAAYEQAIRVFPRYAEAWGDLGIARTENGAHEEAVAAFEHALEIESDRAGYHFGLALALHRSGRLAEAADAYRETLRLEPGHPTASTNLGSILAVEGRFDEAEALWRRVLEADPDHATARENLERLLRAQDGR